MSKTENPLIMRAKEDMYFWDELLLVVDYGVEWELVLLLGVVGDRY